MVGQGGVKMAELTKALTIKAIRAIIILELEID